jgi:hypothetical protein
MVQENRLKEVFVLKIIVNVLVVSIFLSLFNFVSATELICSNEMVNTVSISQGTVVALDDKKIEGQTDKEAIAKSAISSNTPKAVDSGVVFDTSNAGYSEIGEWSTSNLVGFKGNAIHYSDAPKASAVWNISISKGIYKLFYWKSLSDKGAPNSTVKPSCTTATEIKPINFQRGVAGWTEIGTYFVSDGIISVTVSGGDGRIMTSALKFVVSDENSLNLNLLFGKAKGGVMLKIGSQKAFVNDIVANVPDVAPTIQGERALVPIRFISEGLGAKVDWNNDTHTATILIGTTKIDFILDTNKYLVNGEEFSLDQPAIILSDRMMIPLRAFSVSIGKQLFWDERGLIIIADNVNIDLSYDKDLIQAGLDSFN